MPEQSSFRQVEEKHVSTKVERMEWSPKMDLIALSNIQGEVVLHRLSWQKVWTLKSLGDEIKVTGLAWRPDGKVLAVCYTNGNVKLCDVENSSSIHSIVLDQPVSCLKWIGEQTSDKETGERKELFEETSSEYLPKLPSLSKSYSSVGKGQVDENVDDAKKLKAQNNLNVLLIGTQHAVIHLYVYGIFGVGTIDVSQHGGNKSGYISSATISEDLKILSLMLECEQDDATVMTYLLSFDTTLLASRHQELRILAQKFGTVLNLVSYMQSVIKQMSEAWEDILLETDSKLLKFAEQKYKLCSGTVSTDFLQLLMFGTPSDELQTFLLHELTDKGLKKLHHSLDTSYSNIQQLVLKHLQIVVQAIFYHLNDLRGMSQWYDRFGVLGLQPQLMKEALQAAGSMMLKGSELQLVIDRSMKNFKAFFRWLYIEIQRLADEPVPPELSKMTQQDINFVTEFLKENFTEEMDGTKSGFKLEKVGQYLKDEDLSVLPDNCQNMWTKYIKDNVILKGVVYSHLIEKTGIQVSSSYIRECENWKKAENCEYFYPAQATKSLIQVKNQLEHAVDKAMTKPANTIGQSLQCLGSWCLLDVKRMNRSDTKVHMPYAIQYTAKVEENIYIYLLFVNAVAPCDEIHVVRQECSRSHIQPEAVCIKFGVVCDHDESMSEQRCQEHKILDFGFYAENVLTVLLQENMDDGLPLMAQVSLKELAGFKKLSETSPLSKLDLNKVDVGPVIESLHTKKLENMKVQMFAVSGSRKVACVLASSRRRVRVFLMEQDEEEEEDDEQNESAMMQNETQQSFNNSVAMVTSDEDKENASMNS